MQNIKIYRFTTGLLVVVAALYVIPKVLNMALYTPMDYPFVYYSSGLNELVEIDYSDKNYPMTSTKTRQKYSTAECDSLMPVLNYRQLMSDGTAPDTIMGVAVDMRTIAAGRVVFRQSPSTFENSLPKLHTLFESMPLRVGLTVPDDFFRLTDKIEFIDARSNEIDVAKSERYNNALLKKGFTFPAQWSNGNPSARKPYDEGYFSLDAEGQLFHIKMVNGVPFIKNTLLSDSLEIEHFAICEVANRRFYGFVFDKQGDVYVLLRGEGVYTPLKLDIPHFDIRTQQLLVMGDLFYWTVSVTDKEGKKFYALTNEELKQIDSYEVPCQQNLGQSVHNFLQYVEGLMKN
ncbi:MAG: DUF4857 domain-containing protein [Rikenellaceae bacterium]